MRQEEIKCDICGKQLRVDITAMPHAIDYWECLPIEMQHGDTLYAVYTEPKQPIEICDACFKETRDKVRDAIMRRMDTVLEKEGRPQTE